MSVKERRRKQDEETAQVFEDFIRCFQDGAGPPNKIFVKSSVLDPAIGQESIVKEGEIYCPRSLMRDRSKSSLNKAIECARFVRDKRIARGKYHEKPKTNLELLKEELRLKQGERNERNYKDLLSTNQTDTNSTNLFVCNIQMNVKETDLMELFGAYGPLASVKIMWPRNCSGLRTSNCGFVAFMCRKDGERALKRLKGHDGLHIEWGKPVEMPLSPVYIPPALLKLYLPPPPTGLPFNAQTTDENDQLEFTVVKVAIPLDKKVLMLINRMIEFVLREGLQFEATIMTREINNPSYRFLFDTKSSNHIYYRWKLYSILHGESVKNWSLKPFRMFKTGSIWIPPISLDYTKGMPDELIPTYKKLSDFQMRRLIQLIRNVTLANNTIAKVMVFCMEHCDAFEDITEILVDSFCNESTKATKKVGRLYVISDLLYNTYSTRKSLYVSKFETHLPVIFKQLHLCMKNLTNPLDMDALKQRVLKVISLWELWNFYPADVLKRCRGFFLHFELRKPEQEKPKEVVAEKPEKVASFTGFVPSRWEQVDPEQVENQAMHTQQLYHFSLKEEPRKHFSEEERKILRKIEVMVVEYQDELESGKAKLKEGTTIEEELSSYRSFLLENLKKRDREEDISKNESRRIDSKRCNK